MERRKFDDFAEFGNHMYELASEESQVVTAVLLCEDAIKLIRWLMLYDDVTVGSINIENENYHEYDKEFYITLDTDLVLDVIPAYQSNENKYLVAETDVVFYSGNVSSKLVVQNTYRNKYELIIENYEEDECGDCCGDCSSCPNRNASATIDRKLDLIDYIFNHIGDN